MSLSTIPDMLLKGTSNSDLIQTCRALNNSAYIVATADLQEQIPELLEMGANEVVLPYSLTGKHIFGTVKEKWSCSSKEELKATAG